MMPAIDATAEDFAAAHAKKKRFMSFGRAQFKAFPPKWNATRRREQLGTADMRATGEALNEIAREHVDMTNTRKRLGKENARLASSLNLGIDPSKDRNPEKTRQLLSEAIEGEKRIMQREAAAEIGGSTEKREYKISITGNRPTRKQLVAAYWKLWGEIEAAGAQIERATLTLRTLGSVPAVPKLTDEDLERMTQAFASHLAGINTTAQSL
jgi:hypothetical protein